MSQSLGPPYSLSTRIAALFVGGAGNANVFGEERATDGSEIWSRDDGDDGRFSEGEDGCGDRGVGGVDAEGLGLTWPWLLCRDECVGRTPVNFFPIGK